MSRNKRLRIIFAALACLSVVFASKYQAASVLTGPEGWFSIISSVEQTNVGADVQDPKKRLARIDGLVPSVVPAGSPDTRFDVVGTGLDHIAEIDVLDRNHDWKQLPLAPASATRAIITVPSNYLREAGFLIFATEPNFEYAQSVLVYSKTVARAIVDPRFKIKVTPEDIGGGGGISVNGTGFTSGMRVALGRGRVAGVLVESRFVNDSYLEAVVMSGYLPASDLFVTLLSADGKTRSQPDPVLSSYPHREDDFSQHQAAAESPSGPSEEGMKLMRRGGYDAAADKFVEAARLDPSSTGSAPFVSKAGAVFANNAGFAFFKANKYIESLFWLDRACEIDPDRAVAYLNLGDTLAKLNRNAEARQAYAKYLELAPNSKSAADLKRKLEALPSTP